MKTAALVITLLLLTAAAIWDVQCRKIPNLLTVPALAAGTVFTALHSLWDAALLVIILLALFFAGMTGILGSGDIKLIMALTALQGIWSALISTGAAAAFVLTVQLALRPQKTAGYIKMALRTVIRLDRTAIDSAGRSVPFAPYLLLGFAAFRIIGYSIAP